MDKTERMKELNDILAKAADAYYNTGIEIMSDHEYDELYDELVKLESETGIILNGSRTQQVGFEVASSLKKVKHTSKMLSLEKTKSITELTEWLGDNEGFLSWKLDGLTLVLTFENGELVQAVTRGNGETGEDITANARHIKGIPAKIPFIGRMVVRGESLMKYKDFERVNSTIDDGSKYKNPRNLCVGTVRNLDSKVTAERNINFFAFNLVSAEGYENNSFAERINWLSALGFQTVYGVKVKADVLADEVRRFESIIAENEFPSDGLVLMLDDVAYGTSLGETSHAPRNGMAFKWKDETADTILREIEWSASRTGLLNPVAVFDAVELEGTTVSRASVHNVSIVKQLKLGIGDTGNNKADLAHGPQLRHMRRLSAMPLYQPHQPQFLKRRTNSLPRKSVFSHKGHFARKRMRVIEPPVKNLPLEAFVQCLVFDVFLHGFPIASISYHKPPSSERHVRTRWQPRNKLKSFFCAHDLDHAKNQYRVFRPSAPVTAK